MQCRKIGVEGRGMKASGWSFFTMVDRSSSSRVALFQGGSLLSMLCHSGVSLELRLNLTIYLVWFHVYG